MSLAWTTWTMIGGGGLALLGPFILWRTSDWDLKGAALGSAWTLLRRKRTAESPTELEKRLRETWSGGPPADRGRPRSRRHRLLGLVTKEGAPQRLAQRPYSRD